MIRISKFTTQDKKQTKHAFQIRQKVFVEEQEVAPEEEYDEFEDESQHFLVYDKDLPVATARWRPTNNGLKLERFAVLKEYRGKGNGLKILKAVLNDLPNTDQSIYLHAQIQVVDFYKKVGFISEGEMFEEANIQHYKMCLPK